MGSRAVFVCLLAFLLFTHGCASSPPLPAKALELNQEGAAALEAGDLTTAEARLAVAIEYSPRFTEAWVNLGLVELQRGSFEQARKDFRTARDLNPDLPAPHHALGLLEERRGRAASAEQHYRAALKVDPGFPAARVNLARLLGARGAGEEAREQFLRVTQVAPETIEGWAGLASTLQQLGREAEADRVLDSAIARFGEARLLRLPIGRRFVANGEYARAEGALMPITGDPDRALAGSAWAWIAIARAAAGDVRGAASAVTLAQEYGGDAALIGYVARRVALLRGDAGPRD